MKNWQVIENSCLPQQQTRWDVNSTTCITCHLAINIRPDASWQHVTSTHHSKQAFPQLLQKTVHVSVKMQMFDHTWQLSLFPLVNGASLLAEHVQLYPAPLQLVGNPGDWDELCVSPQSLLSLEEPHCLPIFSQSLPLLSTWECAGNRQATETRKTFPVWQI